MEKFDINIRWMIKADMARVVDIEEENSEALWGRKCLPRGEEGFFEILKRINCIGIIAEHKKKVVGYLVYDLNKTRLEIVMMAIAKDYHRKGVGKALIEKMISKLSAHRRNNITGYVRETNLDAQLFLKKMQFKAVKVCRAQYEDDTDAYYMRYTLPGFESEPIEQEVACEELDVD